MSNRNEFQPRRRELLRAAAAGATLALPGLLRAAPQPPAGVLTRAIPSTGEKLPVIGLGTDKFNTAEEDAIAAEIQRLPQLGGTLIDTAAAYGDAESIIGRVLAHPGLRDRFFLATKFINSGRSYAGTDLAGKASFERSLARLQTSRIDLLQVHNLDGVDELMPQLQEWKQAGKIRYIGITTSQVRQHEPMLGFMQKYPLDFVQVDYSLANRDAAQKLLPLAQDRHIAVIANVPFGFGNTLRNALARPLPPWAADIGAHSWAQLLLKYVVSHPAVTVTIPGSTKVAHLQDNQGAALGPVPDEATRRRMEQYWDAG